MTEGIRALLIEDEEEIAQIAKGMLIVGGFREDLIDSVATTGDGLELLTQRAYGLVITDLMQTPSGADVYKFAKERGIQDVYIFSAVGSQTIIAETRKLAGQNFLVKPGDIVRIPDIAQQAIKKVLEQKPYKTPQP